MDPSGIAQDGGSAGERYRFGAVVVDAVAHTLTRDGELQSIEPKAFAVLLVLLRHAGELVGRDPLLDAVWGHRHVTPGVLTRAIAQLRHALNDDAHQPLFIQTQHALGYRFIGELQGEPAPVSLSAPAAEPTPMSASAASVEDAGIVATGPALPAGRPGQESSVPAIRLDAPDDTADLPTASDDVHSRRNPRAGRRRRSDRGWRTGALLSVLVASLITLGWFQRGSAPMPVADASIAVLPFTTLGGGRDDSYFAEGLAGELHDALAGVPGLEVVASRPNALRQSGRSDIKALGQRLGVATILDASVRREGARVLISARLADTGTGTTLWSGSYDREIADVFALQSEIAGEVVQALLGVLPNEGRNLARRLTPTQNIVAYDAYLKGVQQLGGTGSGANLDRAIVFFREALSIDPQFARAQAGICRAEITRFENARDAPAFDRAEAACVRASGMDPGLREVSLALGEMYRARGDNAKAIEQYTRTLDDVALRPAAYVGLARTQGAQGRNALALDYFEQARKLRPNDASIHRERGYHQYLNGDLPGAIKSFREATRLLPDDEGQWSSLGGLYLAAGDANNADEAFQRSLEIKPSYAALSNYGSLKYQSGAYTEAADLYRHAAELDPSDFRIWGNVGDALSALPGSAAQAVPAYRRAADMAASYLLIKADDAQTLAQLGWYRANLGEATEAREMLVRAEMIGSEPGEVAFWNAQTLAVLGDAQGCRARLVRAQAGDIPIQRIRASPLLRSLLETPDANGNANANADAASSTR